MKTTKIDRTGHIYGRLLVLKDIARQGKAVVWECRCACGKLHRVTGNNLSSKQTKSCGCLKRDKALKHGHSADYIMSKTYVAWTAMRQRCNNPKHTAYKYYGGRGISICKRWRKFENFLADMGEVPKHHTLDRVDNSKGYTKSNCRWATRKTQSSNIRSNRRLTYKRQTKTMAEWSEVLNIPYYTLSYRLNRRKWSVEEAFTTPLNYCRRKGEVCQTN